MSTFGKRIVVGLLIIAIAASIVVMPKQVREVKAAENIDVSIVENSALIITTPGDYVFTGTSTSGENIVLGSGGAGEVFNVTISNLTLTTANTISPIRIAAGSTVYLTLEGENVINNTNSNTVSILNVEETANLIIGGDGSLTAKTSGSRVAAIGGDANEKCGNMTVNSGTLNLEGGVGIGSGYSTNGGGGTVTINGGFVTALSKGQSPGIGTGNGVAAASLTPVIINGGTISATSGNSSAPGIGGNNTGDTDNVVINGGNLTAAANSLLRAAYKTSQGFMKVTVPGYPGQM